MMMVLLALVVAGLIAGFILWRRPKARTAAKAVTAGAWKSGREQAATEFRAGYKATREAYDQAQKALQGRGTKRARATSAVLEVLGVTVVTAGGTVYGAAKTIGAARRILVEATKGGRDAYKTLEVEAEVVHDAEEDVEEVEHTEKPTSDPLIQPKVMTNSVIFATATCEHCGIHHTGAILPGRAGAKTTCVCGQEIYFLRATPGETPKAVTQAELQAAVDNPGAGQAPQPEGTDMAAQEATGLTSYSQAHEQIAQQLNDLAITSNNLVASMGDTLAQHSNLIGNAAVLQDLLNQAANIAAQIAKDAAAVATA